MNKLLTDTFEQNFQDFEISELSGTAILPNYHKTTVVLGLDGDQPKLPKILSKRTYNTNFSQVFKKSHTKTKSTPKSVSKQKPQPKSQSRSVSKSNRQSMSSKVKDYFILNHKKINLEQEINPKNKTKWRQPPTSRKPTVQQLREHVYKKELKQCTFQPKITRNKKINFLNKQVVKPVKAKRQGVFDRLYHKNKQMAIEKSVPIVVEKPAKSTRRQSPIQDYLYSDALRRRGRDTLLQKKEYNSTNFNSTFNNSMKMERMAGERFVKQYSNALENLSFDLKKNISLVQMHKLLATLSFTNTKKIVENHPQNTLIYQIYEILGGNIENGVRIKNLLVLLLAVNGIFNVQQVNTIDPIKQDIKNIEIQSEFGLLISQQGTLLMNEDLGKKIHKYFDVMYRNRLSRLKNQQKKKKNGENKQNQINQCVSKPKGGKSKQSKRSSAANSKRQSQVVITQNRKPSHTFKKFEEPLACIPNIPNVTHQTHQSLFSEQNELIQLSKVFNIHNFPVGITLEIELKDGTIKDLVISRAEQILEAVKEFCEINCLDRESESQVLQVAYEAFQCSEP